jgi:pimeloyl-ACP methyl ester carboxylesterase
MMQPIVVGEGPIRILALHGWFGSAAAWKPFADVVDTDRFSYAFMDYRGYGSRMRERGKFTMDEIAHDVLDTADALGWERFDLLGHSMGGKAIQRVLAVAPERVRRLVAVTPVPASGVPFDDATWALFSSAAASPQARHDIIFNTSGARLSNHWVSKAVQHSLDNATIEAFRAYLHAWAKGDFSADVAGNPVPIKVIVGEHDPSLTAEVMRATYLQWFPNATLEVMGNAGHYPMDETPVALATSVESFLAAAP